MPDINWISRQKTFFEEPHEFKQIQRIKDFFKTTKNAPTKLLGDTAYFNSYFKNQVTKHPKQVPQRESTQSPPAAAVVIRNQVMG